MRTWLYRSAADARLSAIEQRGRLALPFGLGTPAGDPDVKQLEADSDVVWFGPIPDVWVTAEAHDPATIVTARQSVRLALIASLQYLPARQRAVLLLREVLGFSASEAATVLETSVSAVKSMLQRARARLDEVAPTLDTVVEPSSPALVPSSTCTSPGLRTPISLLLNGHCAPTPPSNWSARAWFAGTDVPALPRPRDRIPWRLADAAHHGQRPTRRCRYYKAGPTGRALGIAVFTGTSAGIARVTVFPGGPGLVAKFDLPKEC